MGGRILDTPGEPPTSTYKDRLCHGAYPTYEYGGLIFTYMAIITQRSIAVHDLEHLADTDRGGIMLRNKFRELIRALAGGEDPPQPHRENGVIPTYTSDTVRQVPRAATPDEERDLLHRTGLAWAQEYVDKHPPFMGTAPYAARVNPRVPNKPGRAYFDFLQG